MWKYLEIFRNSPCYENHIIISIDDMVFISVTDGHTIAMVRWDGVTISKFNRDQIRVLKDSIKVLEPFENFPIELSLTNGRLTNDIYGVDVKLLPTCKGFTNSDQLLKKIKDALRCRNAEARQTIPVSTFRNIFNFSKYLSPNEEPVIESTPEGMTVVSNFSKSWIIITMPMRN